MVTGTTMWSTYTWVLMVALVAADTEWITDIVSGKKYTIQVAPNGGTRATFQEHCKQLAGMLPEPRDNEENEFIKKLTKDYSVRIAPYLGITGKNWPWRYDHDGSYVTWRYLGKDYTKGLCVIFSPHNWKTRGQWHTTSCDTRKTFSIKFICEKAPIDHTNPENWITHRTTRKQYIDMDISGMKPHDESKEICKRIGGFLPEPKSKVENDFLAQLQGKMFRLGMRYTTAAGHWTWDRGSSTVNWFNWVDPGLERKWNDCAALAPNKWNSHDHNGWVDVKCDFVGIEQSTLLCEKASAHVAPQTTTTTRKPGTWKTDPVTGKRYIDLAKPARRHGGNQEACSQVGGFLPQPKDKREHDLLTSLTTKDFRLGMTYIAAQGVWRWDRDGMGVTWFNCVLGASKARLCAASVRIPWNGRDIKSWVDVDCTSADGTATVVCEKDPVGGRRGIDFAAGADGKLQPPVLLMTVALGLGQLML